MYLTYVWYNVNPQEQKSTSQKRSYVNTSSIVLAKYLNNILKQYNLHRSNSPNQRISYQLLSGKWDDYMKGNSYNFKNTQLTIKKISSSIINCKCTGNVQHIGLKSCDSSQIKVMSEEMHQAMRQLQAICFINSYKYFLCTLSLSSHSSLFKCSLNEKNVSKSLLILLYL